MSTEENMTPEQKGSLVLTRRRLGALALSTAAALAETAAHAKTASTETTQKITSLMQEQRTLVDKKTLQFIVEVADKFNVDDTGYRISNAWQSKKDNLWYIAYQGVVWQENPQLGIVPWNVMDELKPYDGYLEAFYQIPPHEDWGDGTAPGQTDMAFERRVAHFGVSEKVANWLREKRKKFEVGVPTAKPKLAGPWTNHRLQRYVGQELHDGSGTIQRVLVGDIAKHVGRTINGQTIPGEKIIPDEALLAQPDVGSGGGGGEVNQEALNISREVLDKFVAGGEFSSSLTLLGKVSRLNSGTNVVSSSPELTSQWNTIVRKSPGGETYFLTDQKAFVFREVFDGTTGATRTVILEMSSAGAAKNIEYRATNPFYHPKTKWHPEHGIVGTDDFRVTHKYNADSGQWEELEKYVALGTAQQRMSKSLRDFLGDVKVDNGQIYANPLGLNSQEVERYLQTGNDEGLKSFQVLKNAVGEPAVILATGGQYGIRTDLGNIASIKKAVERMNEINPNTLAELTIQFGLRAVAGDIPADSFTINPTYGTTFDRRVGVIQYNEREKKTPRYYTNHLPVILNESRDIYNSQHTIFDRQNNTWILTSFDRLSTNEGIDKAIWLKNWANQNKTALSPDEYKNILEWSDIVYRAYTS